jgi:hypothetical protein
MSKITQKYPQPEGVAAGGTITCRIPVGRRIHALYFLFNKIDQAIADFTEFRVFVNGQIIQRFSGVERNALNLFERGINSTTGVLEIPFDRRNVITLAGREQTAINTGVADAGGLAITSMYLEVDVAGGATIAAADVSLYGKESDAIQVDTNGKPYGAGVIPYIRRDIRSVAGATQDFQISDLVNAGVNAQDKLALDRVSFFPSAGVVNNLKIIRNNYTIFNRPADLNGVIQNTGGKTTQANMYAIDTKENNQGGDVIQLTGMTDYRYVLDVSAAAQVTCVSEYFGALVNS